MKQRTALYAAVMMASILSLPEQTKAQNLEVVGQAKITDMPTDNTADQIVVKLADGTLAVRAASTLAQSTGNYGTVVNPVTGKVWLDRNLGATQVATSSTDPAGYGDLYQWGRNADGHQLRTSGTTTAQTSNYFTTGGSFIIVSSNWLSNVETHMWSGTAAENNPCPSGFRIPTAAEWEQERLSWTSNNAAGAFASPLKLPSAGSRGYGDGLLYVVNTSGFYWSSTVSSGMARGLFFRSGEALVITGFRADGGSIRCIKD